MVYLAALESGRWTPASIVADETVDLKLPNGDRWKPENFDRKRYGNVTLVRGLTQSLNLATVNLGLDVGLGRVASVFEQLGLAEAPPELPSMLLGATNLAPIEVAQMYNTLANGGFRAPLRAVRAVIAEDGQALKSPELEVSEAVSPEAVYALDRMMIEVMERGTGRSARKSLPQGLVVAGKTGTSNDYRDSWFAGFSGGHLIVAWVGHDDNRPTGLTGTTGGLAVWSRLMSSIPTTSFEPLQPDSVDLRWIDYYSGRETSPWCNGAALSMPFAPGTPLEPSEACPPAAESGAAGEEDLGLLRDEPPTDVPAEETAAPAEPEIP
jgi:penicillin-binding protein 1B